ncbi:MAG: ATP-binding protein [Bacteroidota bacterium]|nr:ATP-binding protein [Bacteroidota bacterium]
MIIEFSVKNYRSIKDLQTLSMIAAPIKSKYPELDDNNIIQISDKLSLLKSAAIYGANGSGKSNMVKAIHVMLVFIRDSFKYDMLGKGIVEPFLLNPESFNLPTYLQLIFICENIRYRYGFEVLGNEVKSEWLFGTPDKSEVYFFVRDASSIKINEKKFAEGKNLNDKTSKSNLFLNIVKAFNGKISNTIVNYFSSNISINSGIDDIGFREGTLVLMKNENIKKQILLLLNLADIGIHDILNKKIPIKDLPDDWQKKILKSSSEDNLEFISSVRIVYDQNGNKITENEWLMDNHESDGTQKFFNYSGVITTSLMSGKTLFLDEFDARLHPMLTKKIVEMFNSPILNKNGAQLIFVTHDTNLLDNSLLRRDQIYFTEKNKMQETVLYSLADFKGVRNDASYEKDYINGKYGAIPFLGDFEKLFR